MQRYIFVVTLPDGTKTAHSAIKSFLEHPQGVPLSESHFYLLAKKHPYPIIYKDIVIEKIPIFTTTESRKLDIESRCL